MENSNFKLITLTNSAYKILTENCIKSLININFPLDKIIIYTMDDECKTYFENKYPKIEIKRSNYTKSTSVSYMKQDWNTVTIQKIDIINKELNNYEYLILFDGDIVFNNIKFIDFLLEKMNTYKDLDLFAQHEFKNNGCDTICSGFYIVRSNDITKKYYNSDNYINGKYKGNDQDYINSIKKHLKWEHLPIELFPNGKYYYEHHKNREEAYIVHFNFVMGIDGKKSKMRNYSKWFL
jgi:hypothetical protein